jgi:hypothetical protein
MFQVSRKVNVSRKQRVDKRDQNLKSMLQTGGEHVDLCHLKSPIALPLHPEILVNGVRSSTARIIPSNTYPLVVELRLSSQTPSGRPASSSSAGSGGASGSGGAGKCVWVSLLLALLICLVGPFNTC